MKKLGIVNGQQLFYDLDSIASTVATGNTPLARSGAMYAVTKKEKRAAPPTIGPDCHHDPGMRCAKCFEAYYDSIKDPLALSDDDDEAPPRYLNNNMRDAKYLRYLSKQTPHIKRQASGRIKTVHISEHAASVFNGGLATFEYHQHRIGFLYGRFEGDEVIVETVYEPAQEFSQETGIQLTNDIYFRRVEALAAFLGLTWVGWIVSHKATTEEESPLTATEVVQAAQWQLERDTRFVTVVVSVDEQHQLEFDAFQVSDQACKLARKGYFAEQDRTKRFEVQTTKDVDIMAEYVRSIGTPYLTVPIGISQFDGKFSGSFPVVNRLIDPIAMDGVRFLDERTGLPRDERYLNLQFLLFASEILNMNSQMADMCLALANGEEPSEEYEAVIRRHCEVMLNINH